MKPHIAETLHSPHTLLQLLRQRAFSSPSPSPNLASTPNPTVDWGANPWHASVQLNAAVALAQMLQQHKRLLVVLPTQEEIYKLCADLQALGIPAITFPHWGGSLYKGLRSHSRLFAQRSWALAQILQHNATPDAESGSAPLVVLCHGRALEPTLPPPAQFAQTVVPLKVGIQLQPSQLAQWLCSYGYYRVPRVALPGEFALRGEVVDFCPPSFAAGSPTLAPSPSLSTSGQAPAEAQAPQQGQAVRVVFGFDEIERLKVFDTASQISRHSIAQFALFPLQEVLWQTAQLACLREQIETRLLAEYEGAFAPAPGQTTRQTSQNPEEAEEQLNWQLAQLESLITALANQQEVKAEERLFGLAYNAPAALPDYLPQAPLVLWSYQRIQQQLQSYQLEMESWCAESPPSDQPEPGDFSCQLMRQLLDPKHLALDLQAPNIQLGNLSRAQSGSHPIVVDEFEGQPWPLAFEAALQYHGNLQRFSQDLANWLAQDYYVAIGCSSAAQASRLRHALQGVPHSHPNGDSLSEAGAPPAGTVALFAGELSQGLLLPQAKLALLQEWEILGSHGGTGRGQSTGRRSQAKEQAIARRLNQSEIISSFVELKEGDLVVHVQHGIGRFKGIERVKTARMERDYLTLEYADDNTLFVPIEQVNMVQRYIGSSGEGSGPKLDRIGGKAWQERKAKAQKAVEDLADRLLRLYTRRAAADSCAYAPDCDLMEEFEADFPYEPTLDQLRATQEIKEDLESPWPMDRLLCGDVGFGKTEVAMRAAFKVASQGRQVLVLCPTTILAEQHYQNFCKRFDRFPLRIAMLSRFVERKQQKTVLQALENGQVDILLGTHRILAKDIHLRNLGLIVIDEEQRFGVSHKEQLKLLKTSVDCLSMSATPIPRTLHMSLVQIRDVSMLTTAPGGRRPVETFVRKFDEQSIANAIRAELGRGGQVFYLHNRVEGLEEILLFLRGLVPEALIEMAHGQMENKALEDIMYRFVHGGFNLLLATTIIENGIDIPNVNTIIIDRADRYGIGQLYQLRGRVGRSAQVAYAYLFYPNHSGLSDLALKRLRIIADFTELGSGFKVAMKDLEVRGAGNLLGPEQSGNIISVGFEMYSSMLAKALSERKYQLQTQQAAQLSAPQAHSGWRGSIAAGAELEEEILLELDYCGFIPDAYIPDASEKIDLYKRIASIDQDQSLAEFYEELFDRFGQLPAEVQSLLALAQVRILCRKVGITSLKERQGQVELRFSKARPLPMEHIMRQIQRQPKLFRIDPKQSDALLLNLGEYLGQHESPELQAQPAEHSEHRKTKPKGKQGKHSRNADYLAHTEGPSARGNAAAGEDLSDALLQKTAALRALLSSFST